MSLPTPPAAWTVLLIGGSAGVGKTMIAERIARRIGLPWSQVDDIYQALYDTSTAAERPALHSFDDDSVWDQPPEALCARFVAAAQLVSRALEGVIARHIATASPVVLEGIWIVPALAARATFGGVPSGGQVRAAFLLELDEEQILKGIPERSRWFDRRGAERRRTRARVSALYGQWLAHEAQLHEVPVLTVRPWATLAERILTAL